MSRPVLTTERFELTPLQGRDRDDLFAHFSDPATVEFMDIDPLVDISGADETIAWATRLLDEGKGVRWAIRDAAGGFAGTAGFHNLVREHGSRGEIGYDVVRPRWRQGVMREVLPVVLDYAFGPLELRRVEAMVTPGNMASASLLAANGFRLEGLLREHGHWRGRFWDQQLFATLAGDQGLSQDC